MQIEYRTLLETDSKERVRDRGDLAWVGRDHQVDDSLAGQAGNGSASDVVDHQVGALLTDQRHHTFGDVGEPWVLLVRAETLMRSGPGLEGQDLHDHPARGQRNRAIEPATTMITATTNGAMTHAIPSLPRYGPSVPTFVVGFRPGGRNRNRFLATSRSIAGRVRGAPARSAARGSL